MLWNMSQRADFEWNDTVWSYFTEQPTAYTNTEIQLTALEVEQNLCNYTDSSQEGLLYITYLVNVHRR